MRGISHLFPANARNKCRGILEIIFSSLIPREVYNTTYCYSLQVLLFGKGTSVVGMCELVQDPVHFKTLELK